jgi:hypothetical protein
MVISATSSAHIERPCDAEVFLSRIKALVVEVGLPLARARYELIPTMGAIRWDGG